MNKWVCSKEPELVPVIQDNNRFDQILAEISLTLYSAFRQLQTNQSKPSLNETEDPKFTGATGDKDELWD